MAQESQANRQVTPDRQSRQMYERNRVNRDNLTTEARYNIKEGKLFLIWKRRMRK